MANDSSINNDYPLNCINEVDDGFSGWYAISNPRQCNDFCYWHLPTTDDDDNTTTTLAYTAWNTANPHVSTVVHSPEGTSYWTCIYDAAEDETTVETASGESWVDSWKQYNTSFSESDTVHERDSNDVPFPFLRCQKGAGEKLKTWSGELVKSDVFWESWIVIVSLIIIGEMIALVLYYKKKRGGLFLRQYEQVELDHSTHARVGSSSIHSRIEEDNATSDDDDDEGQHTISSLHIDDDNETSLTGEQNSMDDSHTYISFNQRLQRVNRESLMGTSASHINPRCKYCTPFASIFCKDSQRRHQTIHILRILLILVLNLLLAFTISFASISIMEIHANPHFTVGMQKLTPACADPNLVCPAGNVDIDRNADDNSRSGAMHNAKDDSTQSTATVDEGASKNVTMRPFSYIMASDAQLYWFNGEFAEMGNQSIPPACTPSDSCGRCTGKHGLSTNRRLKKAWENMMTGKVDGLNDDGDMDLPVPNTLVMNGDLTAYFHPYERTAYESIYDNIEGLEYYWPSLGNHDIEHHNGAMFGGDEWVGLPNCNTEHAIGYFKSAFCKKIPAFETERITRYDSSSLAYSWDEGRYHFVHLHYYPTFEIASMNYQSSLRWLERDLQTAKDADLATIIFVHAVQGLNQAMEGIVLGMNVKAIIAGHTHRCLHRRCEGIYPLREDAVDDLDSLNITAEKCIPASYDTCQVVNGASGENLVYLKDTGADFKYPETKLQNDDYNDNKPLCPKSAPFYINETDNTLLCHKLTYSKPNFPFDSEHESTETIPIFWSGSSSFETFLRGDFYDDRVVINAITVTSGEGGVARYSKMHSVPNAVYPYHEKSDMEEIVIYL